jgi:microcystin-dependent protein
MPGENKLDWSVTAASNGTADSGINFAEGQTRASLNDSMRAVMAAEAKERNYQNGSITTSGTAAAQTFTSGVGFSAMPAAGMVVTLKMGFTNPAAFTLNMDATGAVTVKDQFGNSTVGGECLVNSYCTFLWNGTNWVLLAGPQTAFTTGDVKATLKTTADSGWIMMADGTIGSASSGASTRANADTETLFTLLWNNVSDSFCPVSSGRGASAAADFAANKTITVPRTLGRVLGGAGAGSGLTSRAVGAFLGEENHVLTVAELAAHSHSITDPGHLHATNGYGASDSDGQTTFAGSSGFNFSLNTNTAVTGITVNNAGSGTAHNTMQPTLFINWMIKL